ncbi:FG-GAP-like repeat-containing protein [Aestuariicoccus sp. MJ-SS9]|uniref:FG-GAP-like repeat-containing protein n=1 Tax=Aestuariicoccus sp. MJ-SS9 TaxID=3079855 RepID=UPI0029152835|nr:FG-GAP-like repeat-containing protein [Aestuariicoccus sp. MJ-SS9]MDU8910457.1 FG-GAP-like repeat-containing protein [Aestuariicoccus sp. MJ-SS9]
MQTDITPRPIGATPISTLLADVNGDGRLDMVHAPGDWPTGEILTKPHLWLQQPDGSFASAVVEESQELAFPGQIWAKDFNNDGLTDLYVSTLGNELLIPEGSTPDVLYLQNPDGSFSRDTRTELPANWAHATSVGDLNDDGWIDVFSTGGSNDPLYVYWGSAEGFVVDELTGTDLIGPHIWYGPYYRDVLHRTRIQDFDGDGETDLLIGASGWNLPMAPGNAPPVFPSEIIYSFSRDHETRVALPVPQVPWMDPWAYEINNSQIGDLDGDGDMDLVIAYMNNGGFIHEGDFYPSWEAENLGVTVDPNFAHRIIQVLRNDGDHYTDVSEHLPRVTTRNTFTAFEINILDLDADGNLDLFFSPADPETSAAVLLGDGAFGFHEPDVQSEYSLAGWEIADMNGDGRADFVQAWSEHENALSRTSMVMMTGQGAADIWYGTSNDDAVILQLQNEAHAGVGDDHIIGTDTADQIWGGWNNDHLDGAGGADRLYGEHGQDSLAGRAGPDTLDGGPGDDTLNGGGGSDVAVIGVLQDAAAISYEGAGVIVESAEGRDVLIGIETIHFLDATLDLTQDGGGTEAQTLIGTDGADDLVGNEGGDNIFGLGGDDTLDGAGGDDNIGAGPGDDLLHGSAGDDLMGGGTGNDDMNGDAGNDFMGGGQDDDTVDGGDGNDVVNGGPGNDSLIGGLGHDTMGASFGDDTVFGGNGRDDIGGGTGRDRLGGGNANDSIGGGEGDDTIFGGTGDDFLAGGGRDDVIDGGEGNDTINGGDGDDTMTGSKRNDVFVFNFFKDGDADVITDFEDGTDSLLIRIVNPETGETNISNGGNGLHGYVDALNITDTAGGALIDYQGHTVLIEGVAASNLTVEDFTFL